MISRERLRQRRRWSYRRNHWYALDMFLSGLWTGKDKHWYLECHELGTRCCSCYMCDIHKQEPNKVRRQREKKAVNKIIEESLEVFENTEIGV